MNTTLRRSRIILGLVGLCLVLIGSTVLLVRYDTFDVATTVMGPQADRGDVVLVDPDVTGTDLRRGDVVLVDGDAWPGSPPGFRFLLRVAAVSGDRVRCCDPAGRLVVNEEPMAEPFAQGPTGDIAPFTVPPGRIYLLADRRDVGRDSRTFASLDSGTVAVEAVEARAVAVLFPLPNAFGGWGPYLLGYGAVTIGAVLVLAIVGMWLWALVGRRNRRREAEPTRTW